jgi:hypothetical protein
MDLAAVTADVFGAGPNWLKISSRETERFIREAQSCRSAAVIAWLFDEPSLHDPLFLAIKSADFDAGKRLDSKSA